MDAKTMLLVNALKAIGSGAGKLGRTVESLTAQKAARLNPVSEEDIKAAILARIGEGTDALKSGGGFTIDPRTRRMVKIGEEYGYMMSPIRNENAVQIPMSDSITPEDIMAAIPQEYWPRLQKGAYLGSWVEDGKVYLDPAERYITKLASLREGMKSGQLYGADLGAGWEGAGPFYNVTQSAINDELKKRALIALTMGGSAAAGGTAGILRQQ